ncbi:MAG: hypothetical protein WDN27_04330 [Candidatus Saccharibacteria bacterium]
MAPAAHAVNPYEIEVRFDTMHTSSFTSGMVCAEPASTGTEAKVVLTFPTGFTVSSTTSNWTVSTTNTGWPTGALAWPSIATATAAAGQVVTFPSGDLTVGTMYCFNWTNTSAALQNPSSPGASEVGSVTTQTSAAATIDTDSFATATIANDTVVVTATVPPTFTFALSGNTDALSTLTAGTIKASPTPVTATVNTNAKNGWTVWAKDANTGLSSASAGYTIASTTPGTHSILTTTSEGYNTGVTFTQTGGSQTPTVPAVFTGGTLGYGGGLNTTLAPIIGSTGTANNAVVTLTNNVNVVGSTPAATDYTDTITVVGAGLF